MTNRTTLQDWKRGQPLAAVRLQQSITGIRELRAEVDGMKPAAGREATASTDTAPSATGVSAEVWKFVSKTTETERIEDADDPDTYIDVERTTSVTVRTPAGVQVVIEFE